MTSTRDAIALLRSANPVAPEPPVERSQRRYRSPARIGLLVAATAGVAAGALTLGLLPGSHGAATPAAAAALDQAATAADITAHDEAARADQYRRIRTDSTHLVGSASVDGSDNSWLQRSTRTEYVAVDGTRPSWIVDSPGAITQVLVGSQPADWSPGPGEAWTSNLAPNDVSGSWQLPNAAWLAGIPRDTDALRDRLYADTAGHGRSRDGEVLVYVADVLRSGVVPADLRAALFRVLETVPDVDVVRRHADGLISIGRLESVGGERQEIVIDPATGAFVGERTIQVEELGGIPAGTVTGDVTVTATVVDAVPATVRDTAQRQTCSASEDGAVTCQVP